MGWITESKSKQLILNGYWCIFLSFQNNEELKFQNKQERVKNFRLTRGSNWRSWAIFGLWCSRTLWLILIVINKWNWMSANITLLNFYFLGYINEFHTLALEKNALWFYMSLIISYGLIVFEFWWCSPCLGIEFLYNVISAMFEPHFLWK